MKPLRIGINILFLLPGSVGGTEVYSRNLLQALAVQIPPTSTSSTATAIPMIDRAFVPEFP